MNKLVLVVVFILMLFYPAIDKIFGITEFRNVENRNLLTLEHVYNSPGDFEVFFNDHLGGRSLFFNFISTLKFKLFSTSVLPNKILVGKDNFLFLGDDINDVVRETIGAVTYSNEELKLINKRLKDLFQVCLVNDIKLYLLIVPNRHTVLSDQLPFKVNDDSYRKIDQLNELGYPVIDLCNNFYSEEESLKMYLKYNSHWNTKGAYKAYKKLASEIKKDLNGFKTVKLNSFSIDTIQRCKVSLAKRIDLNLCEDSYPIRKKRDPVHITFKREKTFDQIEEVHYKNRKAKNKYKAFVYGDSFLTKLIPFINNSVYETKYFRTSNIDYNLLKEEKPDILIIESVERFMDKLLLKEYNID